MYAHISKITQMLQKNVKWKLKVLSTPPTQSHLWLTVSYETCQKCSPMELFLNNNLYFSNCAIYCSHPDVAQWLDCTISGLHKCWKQKVPQKYNPACLKAAEKRNHEALSKNQENQNAFSALDK